MLVRGRNRVGAGARGSGGERDWGLPVDKGRPRSKNSIISADARTSLGFPGADNGALFEESFRAHGWDTPLLFSSLPLSLFYLGPGSFAGFPRVRVVRLFAPGLSSENSKPPTNEPDGRSERERERNHQGSRTKGLRGEKRRRDEHGTESTRFGKKGRTIPANFGGPASVEGTKRATTLNTG